MMGVKKNGARGAKISEVASWCGRKKRKRVKKTEKEGRGGVKKWVCACEKKRSGGEKVRSGCEKRRDVGVKKVRFVEKRTCKTEKD